MHSKQSSALRAAFPLTLPVMAGYLVLGMGFGILLQSKGYHFGWAILMSLTIYAGSMQYVAVDLLSGGNARCHGSHDPDGQCAASVLWHLHAGQVSHTGTQALDDDF